MCDRNGIPGPLGSGVEQLRQSELFRPIRATVLPRPPPGRSTRRCQDFSQFFFHFFTRESSYTGTPVARSGPNRSD